ncbi:hypothetical protein GCM10027599_00710 [Yimella radicis]
MPVGTQRAPSPQTRASASNMPQNSSADWFNHRRLYEYCGDIPPVELEQAYYARKTAQQTAALTV